VQKTGESHSLAWRSFGLRALDIDKAREAFRNILFDEFDVAISAVTAFGCGVSNGFFTFLRPFPNVPS
jgi:hypothetical protein